MDKKISKLRVVRNMRLSNHYFIPAENRPIVTETKASLAVLLYQLPSISILSWSSISVTPLPRLNTANQYLSHPWSISMPNFSQGSATSAKHPCKRQEGITYHFYSQLMYAIPVRTTLKGSNLTISLHLPHRSSGLGATFAIPLSPFLDPI